MRARWLVWLGLLGALVGCAASPAAQPVAPTSLPATAAPVTPEDPLRFGLQVYNQNYCGSCHALSGAAQSAGFAPGHDEMGAVALERIAAESYTGQAISAEQYIRESIVEPQLDLVPGYEHTNMPMPTYKLSDAEVEALVALLLAQR